MWWLWNKATVSLTAHQGECWHRGLQKTASWGCKISYNTTAHVFSLGLHSDIPWTAAKPFLYVQTEKTHRDICSLPQSLIFTHIGWDIPFCPHGWPALATGHRTVDSRSSLHGDEQDLGRYPAYWKHSLLLTFRNGEWGRALSAGRVGLGVGDGSLAPCFLVVPKF